MTDHQRIADRLDTEYAVAWKPDPGDKLIGEIVMLNEREGIYGVYPVLTVRQDDGTELAFHAFHSVAASALAEQRPQVGERIGVAYKGEKTTQDGKKYHHYAVAKDGPAPVFDWGKHRDGDVATDSGSDLPSAVETPAAAADHDEPLPF